MPQLFGVTQLLQSPFESFALAQAPTSNETDAIARAIKPNTAASLFALPLELMNIFHRHLLVAPRPIEFEFETWRLAIIR